MKKTTTAAAFGTALLALSTTACFKNDSKSSVNADGSGKFSMVMELNLAPILSLMGGGAEAANPLGDDREMLVQLVRAMGPTVDAWTEAKVETTKTGATKFTLAGLTKDFTASGDLKQSLAAASPAVAEMTSKLPDMKMMSSTKDASGNWVISMAGMNEIMSMLGALQTEAAKEASFTPGQMNVSEADIAAQMDALRPMYAQYKPIATMFIKDMSITSELEVGGEILDSKVFKKTGPHTASWTFSGEKLIDMIDGMVNDDTLPAKLAKVASAIDEGPTSPKVAPALRSLMAPLFADIYGGTDSPKLVIKPGTASFDYPAEVAKANASQSPELKKLLEEAAKPASSAPLDDSDEIKSTDAAPKPTVAPKVAPPTRKAA